MWGAIIGDLAGSIYEYNQLIKISKINNIDKLITPKSFYSDDTILTIAILDALLNNKDYDKYLRLYGNKYKNSKPNIEPYFKKIFSPGFIKWLDSSENGKSIGNGAMMRISSIGYILNDEKEIIENVRLATIPSHNNLDAISSTTLVALIIFYARKGLNKEEIIKKLNIKLKYEDFTSFNFTCHDTIDNCLYALFTSKSFEESLRKVISYGGDTDTNACIVGSMAEAIYGLDKNLINDAKKKIPDEFVKVLNKGYRKISNKL